MNVVIGFGCFWVILGDFGDFGDFWEFGIYEKN